MIQLLTDLKRVLAPKSFWQVVREMFANGAMDFAVQLAYFLLLFLFPFIMFLVNVAGLVVRNPAATIEGLASNSADFLAPSMVDLIRSYLSGALEDPPVSVFILSALFTFAAGLSAVQHITRAVNSAFGVEDNRPLWVRLGIAASLVFGFTLLVAALLFLILSPQVGAYLQRVVGLSGVISVVWSVLRWVITLVALTFAFAALYRVAPSAEIPAKWVTTGGLVTTGFLLFATEVFRLWATYLFRPTELYGQLGGGIVLMLWLFGVGLVIRFGIEINAQLARLDNAEDTGSGEGSRKGS